MLPHPSQVALLTAMLQNEVRKDQNPNKKDQNPKYFISVNKQSQNPREFVTSKNINVNAWKNINVNARRQFENVNVRHRFDFITVCHQKQRVSPKKMTSLIQS